MSLHIVLQIKVNSYCVIAFVDISNYYKSEKYDSTFINLFDLVLFEL